MQLYFLSFHPWQSGTQAQMLALDCFIKAATQRKLYLKSMSITWATSLLNKTGMLMTMMSVEISALLPVLPVKQCFSPPSFWIRSTWIIPLQIHTQFMNSKPYIFKKEVTVIVLLVSLNSFPDILSATVHPSIASICSKCTNVYMYLNVNEPRCCHCIFPRSSDEKMRLYSTRIKLCLCD